MSGTNLRGCVGNKQSRQRIEQFVEESWAFGSKFELKDPSHAFGMTVEGICPIVNFVGSRLGPARSKVL